MNLDKDIKNSIEESAIVDSFLHYKPYLSDVELNELIWDLETTCAIIHGKIEYEVICTYMNRLYIHKIYRKAFLNQVRRDLCTLKNL